MHALSHSQHWLATAAYKSSGDAVVIAAWGFQAGSLGCIASAEWRRNTFCYCDISTEGKHCMQWPRVSGPQGAGLAHTQGWQAGLCSPQLVRAQSSSTHTAHSTSSSTEVRRRTEGTTVPGGDTALAQLGDVHKAGVALGKQLLPFTRCLRPPAQPGASSSPVFLHQTLLSP